MYYLLVYIPQEYLEEVKSAMFEQGAGNVENYDYCCWQTKGSAQFRPKQGSAPFLGEVNKIHFETEWKVEFVVKEKFIKNVIDAMNKAHPYEVVAYSVFKMLDF